jgi:hypothetical protein
VILAVESGYRESTESWAAILRDLKRRGLAAPKLVVGDGHLGIWGALAAVFPEAKEQRCWNHRILNVLDKLLLKRQAEARSLLTKIPYAETREAAERQKQAFQTWCTMRGHAEAGRALDRDWERMVTFYQFPHEHWKDLRTSNPGGVAVRRPTEARQARTRDLGASGRVEQNARREEVVSVPRSRSSSRAARGGLSHGADDALTLARSPGRVAPRDARLCLGVGAAEGDRGVEGLRTSVPSSGPLSFLCSLFVNDHTRGERVLSPPPSDVRLRVHEQSALASAPGGSAWPGNATAASEHRRSPRVVDRRQLPDGDAQASVIGAAAEANRHEAAL